MQLRFENPLALWGIAAVACLIALMIWQGRRVPGSSSWRRTTFAASAFLFCVLGLARPQWGTRVTSTITRSSNLFIAVDVSRSMLAQDVTPSRLGFATSYARKLVEQLPGVKVALFPFALDGYMLIPLTADIPAASDMLTSLTPGMTTAQGTDLTGALYTLLRDIGRMESQVKEKGGEWAATQVVLLSDGEAHFPLDDKVLNEFRQRRIPIFTVGVGTTNGTTLPAEMRNAWQGKETLRDKEGRTVLSKLHPETLKKISDVTGGEYFPPHFEQIGRTASRIRQAMQIGRLNSTFKLEKEYYPLLFTLALLFFAAEFSFGRWEYAVRAIGFALAFSAGVAHATGERDAVKTYNEGVGALSSQSLQKAAELFQDSAQSTQDPEVRKKALYNLGNTLIRMGDPTQAILSYQAALDTHARSQKVESEANQRISENIVLAQKIEQQMKQQQQGQDGGDDKDKQKKNTDPKGPKKNYQAQQFSDAQKQRIFDVISGEEQQILQRLQDQKNKNNAARVTDKTW